MNYNGVVMQKLRYSLRSGIVRLGAAATLLTALLCLITVLAWWGPAQREQSDLQQQIASKRSATVNAVRMSNVAHAQRKAMQSIVLLEKKLEVHAGQAELIQGIAKLAERRKVRVISQSFDEGRAQQGDAALYLELGLSGSYTGVRDLLADFSTLPMWIEVIETRIDRNIEAGGAIKAQLRLLTYRGMKGQP